MNRSLPNRQSIRLKHYDYSQVGYYFVTICTQNHAHLFGDIFNGQMILNDAGKMVQTVWDEIPKYYPCINIDAFQIMPNHIHGIINIAPVGAGPCVCPINGHSRDNGQPRGNGHSRDNGQPRDDGQPRGNGQPQGVAPTATAATNVHTLPDVVHRFKTMTTKRYIDGVKQWEWKPFNKRVWQRNYWEHIVRNENELNLIRDYIRQNSQKWEMDKLNEGIGNRVMETSVEYGEASWMTLMEGYHEPK